MQRTLTLAALAALCTLALTCKKEPPVVPPKGGPDTTSHDFTWQIDTLGDGASSVLNDIQVIDENNIWAVGEVFFRDSAGQYSEPPYNIARWNGTSWSYQRLAFPKYNFDCTIAFHLASATTAVLAFGPNSVLISDGGSIARWDGVSFVHYPCLPQSLRNGTIRRIWGTSENQFYVVGLNGTIVRYNNGTWQRLESGTSLHILDIWGESVSGQTGVLAIASHSTATREIKLLKIAGETVETLSDSGIIEPAVRLWFRTNRKYYAVGSGIYTKTSLSEDRWSRAPLVITQYFSSDVTGIDTNDVFIVGAFADVLHYNGSTWRQYPELRQAGSLFIVDFKLNTMAAAGMVGNRALVVRGQR